MSFRIYYANTDVTFNNTRDLHSTGGIAIQPIEFRRGLLTNSITNTGTLSLPTSTDVLVARNTVDTLTNKTLILPTITSINNTGTLSLPTSTDVLVARNTVDTLMNKTLNNPTLNNITISTLDTINILHLTSGSIVQKPTNYAIAEISFYSPGTPYVLTVVQNTVTSISPITNLIQDGTSFTSPSAGKLEYIGTIPRSGIVVLTMSIACVTNHKNQYKIDLRQNGIVVASTYFYHSDSGIYHTVSTTKFLTLTTNSILDAVITSDGITDDINIVTFSIVV